MRTNTRFRLVHARKGEEGKSLLQLEIRFVSGQRKFISTGIYLEPAQWDGTIIKNTDCDAILNKQAQDKITLLRNEEIKQGRSLVPSQVDRLLQGPKSSSTSFLKFARGQINNRKGLADGTIFTHNRAINYLEECFGKFDFEDFTRDNVKKYTNFLENKHLETTSIAKLHQVIKTYLHMADDEMLIKDPYINLKIPRGKHKARQRLDDKEIESLRSYKSENKTIQYMTDLAVVQSWTGMQHRDLMVITYSKNYRQNKRETTIDGLRKKTGEPYFIPISGQVIRIIEKYKTDSDRIFPMISLKTYNEYLKIIADGAGINRNLTSYVLRHTAATWLLRSGVPIEVIQAILGHSKIETTMIYTEIEKVYVSKAMRAVTRK